MIKIIPPKIFSFSECIAFLKRSRQSLLHRVYEREIYKALRIAGRKILIRITFDQRALIITFPQAQPTHHMKQHIKNYVLLWFDLERDISSLYHMAKADSILCQLTEKYYGYRMIRIPDFFEAMSWAIIGQQIHLTFAYRLKKRLVEYYGEKLMWEGVDFCLFPKPDKIALLNVSDLRNLQFSRRKAEYIIDIARLLSEGNISKEMFQQKNYINLKKQLMRLRGVGHWTADYVMMRYFGRSEAFPIADVGLHRALEDRLTLGRRPTIEEIRKRAKSWRGWEAYATFYLWRSLYE